MVTSCNACAHCREMALEDGRFLVSPQRYDALLKTHTVAELEAEGLVRTHPQFRVIALGNTAGVPIGVSSGPNGVTFALSRHRLCRLVVAVVWLLLSSGCGRRRLTTRIRVCGFHCCALTGVPVPAYPGFPLDPPLRSR